MKIVYDSEAPSPKRVVVIDDEGREYPAGCFRISFELTINGKPGDAMDLKGAANNQRPTAGALAPNDDFVTRGAALAEACRIYRLTRKPARRIQRTNEHRKTSR